MKNIFTKFLTKPTRTKITFGNTNEFGGLIAPTKPLSIVNEPVEFTSTVDFTNAQVQGINAGLPYNVYSVLVNFNGVNGWPVVTVLQNTLGANITWTKINFADGWYAIDSSVNIFDTNKTMIFHSDLKGFQVSYKSKQVFTIEASNQILLKNVNLTSLDSDPYEDLFGSSNMSLEIRVYP